MVLLGFEPGTGGLQAQTNLLSYGGPLNTKAIFGTSVWKQENIFRGNLNDAFCERVEKPVSIFSFELLK